MVFLRCLWDSEEGSLFFFTNYFWLCWVFVAALSFSICGEQGLPFAAVRGLLIAGAGTVLVNGRYYFYVMLLSSAGTLGDPVFEVGGGEGDGRRLRKLEHKGSGKDC